MPVLWAPDSCVRQKTGRRAWKILLDFMQPALSFDASRTHDAPIAIANLSLVVQYAAALPKPALSALR